MCEETQVVFCDLGDVVALLRGEDWLRDLRALSLWEGDGVYTIALERAAEAWNHLQRGRITATQFSLLYRDILRIKPISELEFWQFYVGIFREPNGAMIENLGEMRARKLILALFSDIDRERWLHVWNTYRYLLDLNVFHYRILSFEIEAIKIEIQAWQRAFRAVSVLPQNAFFLDDREANIQTAVAAGIPSDHTLLYRADRHDEEAVPFFRRHKLIA